MEPLAKIRQLLHKDPEYILLHRFCPKELALYSKTSRAKTCDTEFDKPIILLSC